MNTIIFLHYYEEITKLKKNININFDIKEWDKIKKLTNPYELIHISVNNNVSGIANYHPLSRSYFKMTEMIYEYNLFNNVTDNTISIACLAEGPGGFMEAIYNYRKTKHDNKDKICGITLKDDNSDIPGWNKLKLRNDLNHFNIYYGNLYLINDIKKFTNLYNRNKAFLVTADGGFDVSNDPSNQELLSYKIIYCEIICALTIQKKGGNFVCKIFDTYTLLTLQMIYILYNLYDKIDIYKPKTSRYTNSEKYIIAKGFKGISEEKLKEYYGYIEKEIDWSKLNLGIDIDNKFIKFINNINKKYYNQQKEYINKTINHINNPINKNEYINIINEQKNMAIKWCNNYNVPINTKSKYYGGHFV